MVSTPITVAAVDVPYSYQVVTTDLENDSFSFSLDKHPEGMTVDPVTGLISWTPQGSQIGSVEVEVAVTDSRGDASTQEFIIEVGSDAINNAPLIVSSPVLYATPGRDYNYRVEATSPDNDELTYRLIAGPSGMEVGLAEKLKKTGDGNELRNLTHPNISSF